jgi:hypothetical protein
MQLEQQLVKLAELELVLNFGISIEDLLYAEDRAAFSAQPFVLLLFLFGGEVKREHWGRRICNRVWSFDPECITTAGDYVKGDYVKIVQKLCLLTGNENCLTDIGDYIDFEEGECWLEYNVGSKRQHWTIEVNDDWADMLALSYVMEDIQGDGYQFYAIDSHESMIILYLDRSTAEKLSDLCNEDLEPLIPSEV